MKLALQVCVSVHVCTMFVSSVLGFIASFYEYPVVRAHQGPWSPSWVRPQRLTIGHFHPTQVPGTRDKDVR